jgi:hypothetical protein
MCVQQHAGSGARADSDCHDGVAGSSEACDGPHDGRGAVTDRAADAATAQSGPTTDSSARGWQRQRRVGITLRRRQSRMTYAQPRPDTAHAHTRNAGSDAALRSRMSSTSASYTPSRQRSRPALYTGHTVDEGPSATVSGECEEYTHHDASEREIPTSATDKPVHRASSSPTTDVQTATFAVASALVDRSQSS